MRDSRFSSSWARQLREIGVVAFLLIPVLIRIYAETAAPWQAPMDSQWQEGNACLRILDGQLPGRDFQLFHGIGCAWLHLPLFLAAGAGIRAVTFSHYATCAILALVVIRSALGRCANPWRISAAVLSMGSALPLFRFFLDPLHNMAATRAMVGVGTLLLVTTSQHESWRSRVARALILAAILAAFHDQGPIVVTTLVGLMFLGFMRRRKETWIRCAWLLCGILLVPLLEFVLCAGRPAGMRTFHWGDLMGAQIWFWAPVQPFFRTPTDLLFLIDRRLLLAVLLHATAWMLVRSGDERDREKWWVLTFYGLSSLLPLLGMLTPNYFVGIGFSGIVNLAFGISLRLRREAPPLIQGKASRALVGAAAVVAVCFGSFTIYRSVNRDPTGLRRLEPVIDAHVASLNGDRELWSFYRSAIDYKSHARWLEAEDLMIYAVGSSRSAAYARAFDSERPRFVNTPSGTSFSDWLCVRYWPVHRQLLCAYEPVCREGMWVTWRKKEAERSGPLLEPSAWIQATTRPAGAGWSISTDAMMGGTFPQLWECRMTHRRRATSAMDSLANRFCRWVIRPEEGSFAVVPFAIDPSTDSVETVFPLVRHKPDALAFELQPEGLWPQGLMELERVEVRQLPEADLTSLDSLLPFACKREAQTIGE